ncbi:GNAT family N-acetyltransferase [Mucilaginibacter sp.]|uniref:GNAT family N-acetyltransferase n=1 Tax=Mucilaginibacter sp. TaxID=1882438 RepID=UPI002843034D|nr:GNAT family N-acetyltransferase [Mucilaginibacter sp.]MDR3696535.1 GNAT family N-acetyltransferase [Mucilaginibacter sp.]
MNDQQTDPTKFPVLTTERLILRELINSDIDELINLRSDAQVNQYLDRPKSITIEEAAAFVEKINNGLSKRWYYWVISVNADEKLIGTICLWNFDEINKTIEVGYELMPPFQGRGLMREALRKVIEFGFDTAGFKQIIAYTNDGNARSKSLLEKAGFIRDQSFEKELRSKNTHVDDIMFSLKNVVSLQKIQG